MTVKTFNTRRKFFGKLVGHYTEAGTGCAGIIKLRFHLRVFRIDTDTAGNAASLRHHYRIKAVELRKRIESNMAAAPHYLRKIGLGIGRRVRMCLTSELLQCQTGFVDRTCRRVVYILPENGKGTPHGK